MVVYFFDQIHKSDQGVDMNISNIYAVTIETPFFTCSMHSVINVINVYTFNGVPVMICTV